MSDYERMYNLNRNAFKKDDEEDKKEESLSTKDRLELARGINQSIPQATNTAGVVNQPSIGGSAANALQSGITTGVLTGNPYAGLAVGGLVATGSYMQASANADAERKRARAKVIADAYKDQATLTQSRGQAYQDYALRMAQLAERL